MKPKPEEPCLYAFSRAWHRLHVFALNSDWSIVLFMFFVIGWSNLILWFWFYDTELKTVPKQIPN